MRIRRYLIGAGFCALAMLPLASVAMAGAEQRCMICHDFTKGINKIGPSLKGIIGRTAGTYPGYNYTFTKYLNGKKPWVWTVEKLRKWDNNSQFAVKEFTGNPEAKTKMPRQAYTGSAEDDIIKYIQLTSEGIPLPANVGVGVPCKMCHDFTKGINKIGPSLKGVLGRVAGTYPGYKYHFTKYIKGKPWVWTEERLRKWDNNSEKAIKEFTGNPDAKTLMPPQHRIGSEEDEIISFIKISSGKDDQE